MVKINLRKEKGITLIALIITIVVLLILAGVTLNIVLNSGIINKSQTAVSKYNEQATKEKLTVALTEYKFKQLAGETPVFNDIITNIGGDVTEETDTEWTIELDGFIFTVNKKTNAITSIEPSNAPKLNPPTIGEPTITLAGDSKSATIEVTVTPQNGGTITSVTIAGQTITEANGKYSLVVTTNGDKIITATETKDGRTKTATKTTNVNVIPEPTPASKTTTGDGYVGCYADIDGNGTIDGIIYADLLVGAPTGEYGSNGNGTYTLPTDVNASNVKDYIVSASKVTDARFEKSGASTSTYTPRYLISPASTTTGTKDRFYVMGLEDIKDTSNNTELYWYKNAYNKMDASDTSVDFGAGKTNTETILAKWTVGSGTGGYGAQEDRDMWKWINVGTGQANEGWFVPSRGEWAAFAKAFNISKFGTNETCYINFGLNGHYWSSSQGNMRHAWFAYLGNDNMDGYDVYQTSYVRLSTTF